jgi:hypothetical protein
LVLAPEGLQEQKKLFCKHVRNLLENASLSWSELIARKFNRDLGIVQPAAGSNPTGANPANDRSAFLSQ